VLKLVAPKPPVAEKYHQYRWTIEPRERN